MAAANRVRQPGPAEADRGLWWDYAVEIGAGLRGRKNFEELIDRTKRPVRHHRTEPQPEQVEGEIENSN